MQVETYEIEELKGSEATTMAADSEAIELAQKLGLEGQLSLCNTETATRNPYKTMTALENLVYGTIFRSTTKVENYRSGIIPLRVLQVIAHCRENQLFHHLEIWHPTDRKETDPILVGHLTANPWDTGNGVFLLARWGDCLLPFEQLAEKAKVIWKSKMRQELTEAVARAKICLEQVETKAEEVFATGNNVTVHFNSW